MRVTTCGEALARAQRFAPSQVMLRRETGKSAAPSSTSGSALLVHAQQLLAPHGEEYEGAREGRGATSDKRDSVN